MRSIYYLMFFGSILFTACKTEPVFPIEETITLELMPLQGITCPFRLEVKNPFLIVQNNQRTDSLFHIYDLNNHKLKSTFGVIGRGPNEFLYPVLYRTQLSDVAIIDWHNDFLTYKFSIDEEGTAVLQETKLPNYIYGIANSGFINDTLLVVDDFISSPNLHILSFNDELPKKSWQYGDPTIMNRFIDANQGTVYANNSRIVFCYGLKKQIDFMDIDLNHIKRVEFSYTPVAISEQNQSDAAVTYSTGYLGKRYFYALFHGVPLKEYRDLSFRGSILEVFDLDGNPVIKYHFDHTSPDFFVVDEQTFTLYGGRYDGEPEDCLLVYKLKGLS